jgi:hypothetical protein
VRLEGSTKPHVHNLIHEFLINMAFTMACPNIKKGLKMVSGPLGINPKTKYTWSDKPVWAVLLDLILFLNYLNLFGDMRLAIRFMWVQIP